MMNLLNLTNHIVIYRSIAATFAAGEDGGSEPEGAEHEGRKNDCSSRLHRHILIFFDYAALYIIQLNLSRKNDNLLILIENDQEEDLVY